MPQIGGGRIVVVAPRPASIPSGSKFVGPAFRKEENFSEKIISGWFTSQQDFDG